MRFVGGPVHGQEIAIPPGERRWEVAEMAALYATLREQDDECPVNMETHTHRYEKVTLFAPCAGEHRGIYEEVMLHEWLIPGCRAPDSTARQRWLQLRQPPAVMDPIP